MQNFSPCGAVMLRFIFSMNSAVWCHNHLVVGISYSLVWLSSLSSLLFCSLFCSLVSLWISPEWFCHLFSLWWSVLPPKTVWCSNLDNCRCPRCKCFISCQPTSNSSVIISPNSSKNIHCVKCFSWSLSKPHCLIPRRLIDPASSTISRFDFYDYYFDWKNNLQALS